MSDDLRSMARRWFEEMWNQRRPELIEQFVAPGSVCHSDSGDLVGPADFRSRVYDPFLATFPDQQVVVEDILVEGEQAVVRWMMRGTHTGPGLGFAPTGQSVEVRGVSWIKFRDGQFHEGWDCWNVDGLMRKLASGGVPPAPHS